MLKQVGGALANIGTLVRASHERYDGTGYPDRLAGEHIPIESRVVSICDAYNAMTTDRAYRSAIRPADAIAELRRCAGTQFDRRLVNAFVLMFAGNASGLRTRSAPRQAPPDRHTARVALVPATARRLASALHLAHLSPR
jgi:HD-GYP domain-containing protein (c-di-GMP phosphodiesterase class II)